MHLFNKKERNEMSKTEKTDRKVTHQTPGFLALSKELRSQAMEEFQSLADERNGWFYAVLEGQVFIVANEEGGPPAQASYTAMLAEEY